MKKIAAFWVLVVIVYTGVTPLSAQTKLVISAKKSRAQTSEFAAVRAISEGAPGALLRWTMKTEVTAAYNVYRIDGALRVRLNESYIAGSATRYGEAAASGETYQFFDADGRAGNQYAVEGVRTDGTTFFSPTFVSAPVASVEAETGISSDIWRSATLSKGTVIESRTAELNDALADLVSAYAQQPDPVNQRQIASKPGAKIAVRKDGFYRVTAGELQAAGFPIDGDSAKWRLFTNGAEQSIIVGANGSYIEFYGRGTDHPETDTRYYYLISDTVAGKRVGSRLLRSTPGAASVKNYPVVAAKKERIEFNSTLFNGDEENFLGQFFSVTPYTFRFNLSGIDTSVSHATVKISLFGMINNQHEVRVKLNGVDLEPMRQFGAVFYSGEFQIPTSGLREGENELQFVSHAPSDFNQFDKVEVSYRRRFEAESGKLSFSTPGYRKIDLTGFTSDEVRVFDLTFEGEPVLLSGLSTTEAQDGFGVRLPSTRAMVGYAVDAAGILSSPSVTSNAPSTLAAVDRRSDMLIISAPAPGFMAASQDWALYRRTVAGGGLNADVIDVTDIYDEFDYGMATSTAIKNFLEYTTTNWRGAPQYVLLIGDATYDPRNYLGYGNNLMPTRTVTLSAEESGSDEALGDFDGDGLSEIAIGRIPARTPAQIAVALSKTMVYDSGQANLARGVLLAHDNSPEFESMSQQLAQRLPEGTPVTMVAAGEANANANLLSAMRDGKSLVNYSGHGGTGLWANSDFFTLAMVPQVTNERRPSMYSMLTCVSGYFLRPTAESLGEDLLFSPAGGAAASWASTSRTVADDQLTMADRYFLRMAESGDGRVGDLIKEAKTTLNAGADVRLSWVLLGDPALRTP